MSGHPRTHQNAILRTYAGLLLISICVYTLMYAPQPMFNSVSRDFGVDKGSTGLLVSVFMLSLAVSPLCVGMLLSRIGVRRAILGASLLLGISGAGIWFAPFLSFSASALYRRCWFRWCSQPSCPALPSCSATWISTVRLRAM